MSFVRLGSDGSQVYTGGHWGRTIVRVGQQDADSDGRRPDDELVGLMDDPALAERICELLNHTCPTCTGRRTGPCSVTLPSLILGQSDHLCELPHGHSGDHVAGPTRWRTLP